LEIQNIVLCTTREDIVRGERERERERERNDIDVYARLFLEKDIEWTK
jgi:hypothetical protein